VKVVRTGSWNYIRQYPGALDQELAEPCVVIIEVVLLWPEPLIRGRLAVSLDRGMKL